MALPVTPNVGTNLVLIHRAITRGLTVVAEWSNGPSRQRLEDAALRRGLLTYVRSLVTALHAHHLAEDEVHFPFARGAAIHAPYDTLIAEHGAIVEHLAALSSARDGLDGGADPAGSLRSMCVAVSAPSELGASDKV